MSAGAGRVGRSRRSDFYPTTPAAAAALVVWWCAKIVELPRHVIDPCAGVGCILDPWSERGCLTWGSELDERLKAVAAERHGGVKLGNGLTDARRGSLAYSPPMAQEEREGRELVVVNPPFSDADRWVKAATGYGQRRGADVAILLRSQWLDDGATKGRDAYRYGMPPRAILRLPWRISFDGDGADSCTYAWHIWRQPWLRQSTGAASGVSTFWATPRGPRPSARALEVWRRGAELSRGGPGSEQLPIFGG